MDNILTEHQLNLRVKENVNSCKLNSAEITESLVSLGFNMNSKGVVYIKEAISLCANDSIVKSVCRDVYTKISRKYDVSITSINNTIRRTIESVWYSDRLNTSHKLFECSYFNVNYAPTNLEFIATMTEIVRLNNKKSINTSNE